ncbi:MAG: methyltransferase domain-containing protein [Saprospiraceae bacterium]|nr:methyltransferase domain-containing protein [Saprospiraceae bacterium]
MDLKELESGVDPKVHWYYQSKKKPLFSYFEKVWNIDKLPLTVIDFGAGSGFFSYELNDHYPDKINKIYLVDIGYSESELAETAHQKIQKTHFVPENVEKGIVILMDVLEHIEDDHGIAKEIASKAKGHYFFITVPAFQGLWSGHDVFLGHYRRYTLDTLQNRLSGTGFNISKKYYIYFLLFFPAWIIRRIIKNNPIGEESTSDMKPLSPIINSMMLMYNSLEMKFRFLNKICGVTCVAEGKIL